MPQKEFGLVRMGGTVGWILAAWPFTFIFVNWGAVNAAQPKGLVELARRGAGESGLAGRRVAGRDQVDLRGGGRRLARPGGVQPHPAAHAAEDGDGRRGRRNLAWLEALKLLKHPFVLVLWLVTLLDSFVHNCYFNWTGTFLGTAKAAGGVGIAGNWIMPVMSIGQIARNPHHVRARRDAEAARLAHHDDRRHARPRGAVWRSTPSCPAAPGLIILVQVLHGICYAFFFATVYIFVDAYFPKDIRSSAQGLFNLHDPRHRRAAGEFDLPLADADR
jgi:hypothetical protein